MIHSRKTRWITCRSLLLFAFLPLYLPACRLPAQAPTPTAPETAGDRVGLRIRRQLIALNAREAANASNGELGYRWMVLGHEYSTAGEFTNSEDAYNHALELLGKTPDAVSLDAEALDQLGALYRIYGRIPESLNCRQKALALRQTLGDPQLVALSRCHLAELALVRHRYREAFREADEAYGVMETAPGGKTANRITALIVRSYANCGLRHRGECLSDAEQALAISRAAFPQRSPEFVSSLMVLSFAQLHNGEAAEAEDSAREVVGILRSELSADDPRLAFALSQDRDCLVALHRKEEARQVEAQLAAIGSQSATACVQCTVSAFGLNGPSH